MSFFKGRSGRAAELQGSLNRDVGCPPPQCHLLLSLAAWETASALRPRRNAGNRGLGKARVPERNRASAAVP